MESPNNNNKTGFVSVEGAEFFKVFLPSLSSHQLIIPPDFIKKFRKTMKDKVILKNKDGKIWYVDVKETPDGVFLKDGWSSFVDYHGLKAGEFLVFRYAGCFSFLVQIFGINGCKKETFEPKKIATDVKSEEESDEETKPTQTTPQRSKRIKREIQEVEKTEKVARKMPSFVASPLASMHCKLKIPKEVKKSGSVPSKAEMILRDAKGKEWPVRITTYGPTYLGKGLFAFQKDNDVGPNDTIKFTFATRTTINVKILRNSKKSSDS